MQIALVNNTLLHIPDTPTRRPTVAMHRACHFSTLINVIIGKSPCTKNGEISVVMWYASVVEISLSPPVL